MIALGLEDYNDGILPTASVCVFPVKVEVARRTLSLIDLTNKVKICSGIESTFYVLIITYTELLHIVVIIKERLKKQQGKKKDLSNLMINNQSSSVVISMTYMFLKF